MEKNKLVPLEPTEAMIEAARDQHEGEPYLPASLYKAMLAAAPAVQGEPVAWSGWGCQYPGKMPRLYGDRHIAELNCDAENGDQVLYFTATAQTAERGIPGSHPISGQIFFRGASNEWVLELTGSINSTAFTARHTQPADIRPEDVAGLPALYETAPDVATLVEALSALRGCIMETRGPDAHSALVLADAALADYRKGDDV